MEKRDIAKWLALYLIFLSLLLGLFFLRHSTLTGFAVFQQQGSGFDEGAYENTTYNGSAVILSEENLSGIYTSRVFDADGDTTWNNLTWTGSQPSIEFLYGVDGSGAVYSSSDSGVTWTKKTDDYGRGSNTADMFTEQDYLYIAFSGKNNKEVYRSEDFGETWSIVNDTFTSKSLLVGDSDANKNLYIATGPGKVFKSTDFGVSWTEQGDFNGEEKNNAKGIAINSQNIIFIVDGSGAVYSSSDSGVTWTQKTDDYEGGSETDDMEVDSGNNLYILLNKKIYNSADDGVSWSIVNQSFTPYTQNGLEMLIDSNDNFFIIDKAERVFKSTDFGVSWTEQGDFNGEETNNAKGLTNFIQPTNLTFQVRNCSLADCSDADFTDANLNNLNLSGRYFQYKVSFSTPDTGTTPTLISVSIDYDLVNSPPNISLIKPQEGDAYGNNASLPLEFSASDIDNNIDSCWYNIDNENNITITNCQNTTFDVAEGSHTINIYVNDTQGEEAQDNASFTVQLGAPNITLISPLNVYLASHNVEFKYTPSDIDLQACELWGDFNETFKLNQTDLSPDSGIENTFSSTLEDRAYIWNIKCNDSQGNSAFGENKTFTIDTLVPLLNLTQPSGTKSSRTLTALWQVSDLNLQSCWYNVYRGVNLEISNTSTICSENSTTFSVTLDADFTFNFYANDSAGNLNFSSSEFSITASPASSGGGGGGSSSGGGGGGSSVSRGITLKKIQFGAISNLIAGPGETKKIILPVENTGKNFLNDCKLAGIGEHSSWISAEEIKDLSPGEKHDFIFSLKTPETATPDKYNLELSLLCFEHNETTNFIAEIIEKKLFLDLVDIKREKSNTIKVTYLLEELSGSQQEVEVEVVLFDYNNERVAENKEIKVLETNSEQEFETLLTIPASVRGNFNLLINAISGISSAFVQEDVILGNPTIGGLTVFLNDPKTSIFFNVFLIILFLLFVFLVVRRILRLKKPKKRLNKKV
jgi:photosystem II stability/assembly factor-like uncharacterized protein